MHDIGYGALVSSSDLAGHKKACLGSTRVPRTVAALSLSTNSQATLVVLVYHIYTRLPSPLSTQVQFLSSLLMLASSSSISPPPVSVPAHSPSTCLVLNMGESG